VVIEIVMRSRKDEYLEPAEGALAGPAVEVSRIDRFVQDFGLVISIIINVYQLVCHYLSKP
jgi:hypothetical protein